mgnify:CR=1 FL=1
MKPKEKSFSIKFLKDNIKTINGVFHEKYATFLCSKIPELECENCIFNSLRFGCLGTFDYDFNAIKNHKFGRGKRKVTIRDLEQFRVS